MSYPCASVHETNAGDCNRPNFPHIKWRKPTERQKGLSASQVSGKAAIRRKSKHRPKKRRHKAKVDEKALAEVLAMLGKFRLASNVNQIAKLANMGALAVTPELLEELRVGLMLSWKYPDETPQVL